MSVLHFWFFGTTELLRENKRALDKSIREIERERQNLQNQEKKLIVEIKKTAKQGQMVGSKFNLREFPGFVYMFLPLVCATIDQNLNHFPLK